ncbi:putative thiazole-containing bacteriocin maturation protein [Alkalihalobacillus sp. AL-G]|uniref:putative thiazole-containing bacteriocin maturation protein n=1 Tax=Alkalihalobacillus sp. AL-G TaxID=2926399 RepID=UPI00272BC1CA|nr:putative thiazole-containing bacteriocin maturation protein [Alkalihalobacillus sp. AL-G]WLD92825.1 putative thiazole-containing bacteriocin maturation protein [Alkalihalobacillus sp. AL-G]
MKNLTHSMRPKVKRDTFFLPDSNSGVYFRNNSSSFRMQGSTIDQWIEKLIPMFNGESTLGDLTDGLPGPYRERVYEITEVLYRNGFVRDVSQDRPHQLSEQVLEKYASQIEFLDSLGESGASRFQMYRQAKVLAIGSGSFFVSLVSALIESGLPKFHILVTDSVSTNRFRIKELIEHTRRTVPEAAIEEVNLLEDVESSWREAIQPFDSILYVSEVGDVEQLRVLNRICGDEKKRLIPAMLLDHVGLAGPLVDAESEGCWESAWRSIHRSVFSRDTNIHSCSSPAGAMLANVIVFELFKRNTGVTELDSMNRFFLLNLETLEGKWHSYKSHPFVTDRTSAEWVEDINLRLTQTVGKNNKDPLFLYFSQLTSAVSGIFHIWEEGDLKQLPLAQCLVQVVDPKSEGPADLLPKHVCSELTHEQARREAGLIGIETYVTQMIDQFVPPPPFDQDRGLKPQEFVGVGAGESFAEGVCRGLQTYLFEVFKKKADHKTTVSPVKVNSVEDDHCRFYLEALTKTHGAPIIGLGEEVSGFPVVWVGSDDNWYGSVGLNETLALRNALQHALLKAQNELDYDTRKALEFSQVPQEQTEQRSIDIRACKDHEQTEILRSAIQVLENNQKRLLVFELMLEPMLKKEILSVFGVLLREEASR